MPPETRGLELLAYTNRVSVSQTDWRSVQQTFTWRLRRFNDAPTRRSLNVKKFSFVGFLNEKGVLDQTWAREFLRLSPHLDALHVGSNGFANPLGGGPTVAAPFFNLDYAPDNAARKCSA